MKRNKSGLYCILFSFFLAATILHAEQYASLVYAEGSSFQLIRNGSPRTISVSSNEVFGMEVKPGDIFQTAAETMLEFIIHEVGATVKIAENTSFRFNREDSLTSSSGELYYGRVRAKVERLAQGRTYRIASPSLVAGVRGTDFGLDVIAFRRTARSSSEMEIERDQELAMKLRESAVLHRVFCFEGSVLVGDFSGPELDTILLVAGEKVERLVLSAEEDKAGPLKKEQIDSGIREFWDVRPFKNIEAGLVPVTNPSAVDLPVKQPARKTSFWGTPSVEQLRIPGIFTSTLMVLGSSAFAVAAVMDSMTHDDILVRSAHMAGSIMIGSGVVITVLSLITR